MGPRVYRLEVIARYHCTYLGNRRPPRPPKTRPVGVPMFNSTMYKRRTEPPPVPGPKRPQCLQEACSTSKPKYMQSQSKSIGSLGNHNVYTDLGKI